MAHSSEVLVPFWSLVVGKYGLDLVAVIGCRWRWTSSVVFEVVDDLNGAFVRR